ncbi:MAG: hypothetical protein WCO10_00055 [bacterium]
MKYGDVTMGQVEAAINILGGIEGWNDLLARKLEIVKKAITDAVSYLVGTSKQVVNYGRSVKDSLKAGKYDWVNDDITDKNFPSKEEGEREVEFGLFHFNKVTQSDDNVAEMKKAGFRPATIKEMLAYGEKNPEVQREFPVIALGSVARLSGYRRVGCLNGRGSGRRASLDCYGLDWSGYCRFLGVRI